MNAKLLFLFFLTLLSCLGCSDKVVYLNCEISGQYLNRRWQQEIFKESPFITIKDGFMDIQNSKELPNRMKLSSSDEEYLAILHIEGKYDRGGSYIEEFMLGIDRNTGVFRAHDSVLNSDKSRDDINFSGTCKKATNQRL